MAHLAWETLGMLWSSIKALLGASRPTAVGRLVVPIVVDPVDLEALGPFTHVREKVLKDAPTVADFNSSTSVVGVRCAFGVKAALDHSLPYVVSRRSLFPVRLSPLIANLTARTAASQFWKFGGDLFYAAFAANPPAIFYAYFGGLAQYDKTPKALAGNVVEGWHSGEYGMGIFLWQGENQWKGRL